MADLASGGYPQYSEPYLLAGKPATPFRENGDRRYLSGSGPATSGTMFVVPLPCQPGDLIGALSVLVKTASVTPTHGWVALYTGLTAASTLIFQSPDDVLGFHGPASAWKGLLSRAYQVGGQGGTPQGAAYTGGPGGPNVLGAAVFNQATTGAVLDGFTGSDVAGGIVVPGDLGLVYAVTGVAGAVAPATLAGIAAVTGFVPYVKATFS